MSLSFCLSIAETVKHPANQFRFVYTAEAEAGSRLSEEGRSVPEASLKVAIAVIYARLRRFCSNLIRERVQLWQLKHTPQL